MGTKEDFDPDLILADGRRRIVLARLLDGSSPGAGFYGGLGTVDQRSLKVIADVLAEKGVFANREKFKAIEGSEFFELKKHQIRMPCYWDEVERGKLVVTHGFIKKGDKIPPAEIERARRISKEYQELRQRELLNPKAKQWKRRIWTP